MADIRYDGEQLLVKLKYNDVGVVFHWSYAMESIHPKELSTCVSGDAENGNMLREAPRRCLDCNGSAKNKEEVWHRASRVPQKEGQMILGSAATGSSVQGTHEPRAAKRSMAMWLQGNFIVGWLRTLLLALTIDDCQAWLDSTTYTNILVQRLDTWQ